MNKEQQCSAVGAAGKRDESVVKRSQPAAFPQKIRNLVTKSQQPHPNSVAVFNGFAALKQRTDSMQYSFNFAALKRRAGFSRYFGLRPIRLNRRFLRPVNPQEQRIILVPEEVNRSGFAVAVFRD
jgi:hypothetical protein